MVAAVVVFAINGDKCGQDVGAAVRLEDGVELKAKDLQK